MCSPILLPVSQAGNLASSLWSAAPHIQDVSKSCQFFLHNSSRILVQAIFILYLDYWSTLPLFRPVPNNVAKTVFPLHHANCATTLVLSLWRAGEGSYARISMSIGGQPQCINYWGYKYQSRRKWFKLEANSGIRSNGCKLVMKDWKLDGF